MAHPREGFTLREVWKYDLPIDDKCTIPMPPGAKVLHIGVQQREVETKTGGHFTDVPCLWALVEGDSPSIVAEDRVFYTRGTGHMVEEGLTYLGTYILGGGKFVGHVFEKADG